jgi:transcriptional regulator with XRE-family HTH domain
LGIPCFFISKKKGAEKKMVSGDVLRRIRLSRNLSRRDIANATGINFRVLTMFENFEREPSQEQYDAYLKAVYTLKAKDKINVKQYTTKEQSKDPKKE